MTEETLKRWNRNLNIHYNNNYRKLHGLPMRRYKWLGDKWR